ncbi:MAG: tetratricopeptide repeat protein [Deltaproteobacteria bacterium]|nr:MAG: tetratricopeptide repeat protein [Deltaproteobacteria bacterium]
MENSRKKKRLSNRKNVAYSPENKRARNKAIINHVVAIILIAVISSGIYYNILNSSFHFDDQHVVVKNPSIRYLGDLKTIVTHNRSRPILYFTFALNYYFNRENTFGYHLVSLILHILTASLFYLIIFTIGQNFLQISLFHRLALFSAVLYTVNPIHTESVSYISSRSAVMCTTFYLIAVYLFLKAWVRDRENPRILLLAFSAFSFIMALGTKEIPVTLPVMLLILDFLFIYQGKRESFLPRIVRYHSPFFGVLLLYFVLRYTVFGTLGNPQKNLTVVTYLSTQFNVILNYFRLLFFPVNLCADPDFPISPSPFVWEVMFSIIILAGILYLAFKVSKSYPQVTFGIFWFFIALVPTSSILPLYDVMAEHRLYLPSVGFFLVMGAVLNKGFDFIEERFFREGKVLALSVLILLVFGFSFGTIQRNLVWENEFTLWTDVMKKSPRKDRTHYGLGFALDNMGHYDEALKEYRETLRINPNQFQALNDLGGILLRRGQYDEAIVYFQRSLAAKPDYLLAMGNLAKAYEGKSNIKQAVKEAERMMQAAPTNYEIHNFLGTYYAKAGKLDEAIAEFKEAVRLNPRYSSAWNNLEIAMKKKELLKQQGIINGGASSEIPPDSVLGHFYRGIAFQQKGELDKAVTEYQEVLKIDPEYFDAYINLGLAYFKLGDNDQAINEFSQALKLRPQSAVCHTNLGAIYARLENKEKAIYHFRESLRLDPHQNQARIIEENIKKLETERK